MGLLDNCEPATRSDTSDYSVDAPIMDGPYGNAADHALATAGVPEIPAGRNNEQEK